MVARARVRATSTSAALPRGGLPDAPGTGDPASPSPGSPVLVGEDELDPILRLAVAGDPAALEALVRLEWPRLHRIVRSEIGDRGDAEDLTQETFARVLPRLGQFRDGGCLARLFDPQAANLAARPVASTPLCRPRHRPGRLPGPRPGRSLTLTGLDHAALYAALDRLDEDHRVVLQLRLTEGYSSTETAEKMGRNVAAVRQLQHRALLALRQHYEAVAPAEHLAVDDD